MEPAEFLESALKKLLAQQLELTRGMRSEAGDVRASAVGIVARIAELPSSPRGHAVASIAHANIAAAEAELGDIRAALATILHAEEEAELGGDPVIQAKVYLATASLFSRAGEFTLARRWFQRTLALPDLPASDSLLARSNMAGMLRAAGRLPQASEEYDSLAEELTRHASALPASRRAVILINMASCWSQVDRLPDAEGALDQARVALEQEGRADLWAWVDAIRSWVRYRQERYQEAVELAALVLDREEQLPLSLRSSAARAQAAAVADWDAADLRDKVAERLEALLVEATAVDARATALAVSERLSAIREAQGDLESAVRHMRRAQRIRTEARDDEAHALQKQEELQIEIVRMQLENTYLRAHQEESRRAQRELERLDEERVRLTRTIAHDLRNLLNVVKLGVAGLDERDPATVREDREFMLVACDRMEALIEAELGQGEPPTLKRLPAVSLRSLLEEAASVFGILASRKSQVLEIDGDDVQLRIDPSVFGRVIDNLLTNAMKFSPQGGAIRMAVKSSPRGVEVSVSDTGPGFPDIEEGAGVLYGTQLVSHGTEGEEGFGIGLHTAYQAAVALGGTLRVGNGPDGGACVRLLLPHS